MRLIAVDGARDVGVEVELRRVLPPESDQIAREGEVVTDEDLDADGDLEGHGAVIGGPDAYRGAGFLIGLDREIEDREEASAVTLDGELLLPDLDASDRELPIDRLDQIRMRDRFPGWSARRGRDGHEL